MGAPQENVMLIRFVTAALAYVLASSVVGAQQPGSTQSTGGPSGGSHAAPSGHADDKGSSPRWSGGHGNSNQMGGARHHADSRDGHRLPDWNKHHYPYTGHGA